MPAPQDTLTSEVRRIQDDKQRELSSKIKRDWHSGKQVKKVFGRKEDSTTLSAGERPTKMRTERGPLS